VYGLLQNLGFLAMTVIGFSDELAKFLVVANQ
jgi:hypothetical protein